MYRTIKNKSGFTLIELLVVVLIIGILSGVLLTVLNPSGLQAKARDSQRKADLKKIQAALELYFADNRAYPLSDSSNWENIDGTSGIETALEPGYLSVVPHDPTATTVHPGPCNDPTYQRYNYRSNGNQYLISAIMEVSTSNDDGQCTDLNIWSSYSGCGGTFATSDYCYGVENP